MLAVNDDMDELFRQAAENYPLKTDNPNWEKVRKKLHEGPDQPEDPRSRDYRWLLLLLLLPLGWLGYKYFPANNGVPDKKIAQEKNSTLKTGIQKTNTGTDNSNPAASIQKALTPYQSIPANVPVAKNNYSKDVSVNKNSISTGLNKENNATEEKTNTATPATQDRVIGDQNVTREQQETVPKKDIEDRSTTEEKLMNTAVQPKATESNIPGKATTSIPVPDAKTTADVAAPTDKNVVKTSPKASAKKGHFLYIGVMGGFDVSTVKLQSVKGTGSNIGLLLGYQLNKKFGFETGIMLDKKYYYSDGKYFNTAKINLPNYAQINDVTGNCSMFEVPLNLRYNFSSRSQKANFFAIAGLSSYFMKHENYDYTLVTTGQPYPYYKSYSSSSAAWLSVVNISAGYSHSIGKIATFRVEPYVKIPLTGVGIGSMPITSLGINVGITKKLF